MTQEKKNRIAAAITVNAVILIVVLVAVIIYQLAVIVSLANKENRLKKDIEKALAENGVGLETIEELKEVLDYSDQQLLYYMLTHGYVFESNAN